MVGVHVKRVGWEWQVAAIEQGLVWVLKRKQIHLDCKCWSAIHTVFIFWGGGLSNIAWDKHPVSLWRKNSYLTCVQTPEWICFILIITCRLSLQYETELGVRPSSLDHCLTETLANKTESVQSVYVTRTAFKDSLSMACFISFQTPKIFNLFSYMTKKCIKS